MSRVFRVGFKNQVVPASTPIDIFELLAPSSGVVMILDWSIWQKSDVGDAQEEILGLECVHGIGSVTAGSGGATLTPQSIDNGDSSANSVVKGYNDVRMTAGTGSLKVMPAKGFNVRIPDERILLQETRDIVSTGNRWTLSLFDGPVDDIALSAMLEFAEIG